MDIHANWIQDRDGGDERFVAPVEVVVAPGDAAELFDAVEEPLARVFVDRRRAVSGRGYWLVDRGGMTACAPYAWMVSIR